MMDSLSAIKTDYYRYVNLKQHNLNLVNVCNLILRKEHDIINMLYECDLLSDSKIKNLDTKKILYHHVTKIICDFYLKYKQKEKVVLIYNEEYLDALELNNYLDSTELTKFMKQFIGKVRKSFPFTIHETNFKFNKFEKVNDYNNGDIIEVLTKIKSLNNKKVLFKDIEKFSKKYELNYLTNEYFTNLKFKASVIGK